MQLAFQNIPMFVKTFVQRNLQYYVSWVVKKPLVGVLKTFILIKLKLNK